MLNSFAPTQQIPAAVKSVEIVLRVMAGTPNDYAGRYSFDILDASGTIVQVRGGDILPHLTTAQRTAIRGFLDATLTKAQGAIA